MSDCVFCVKIEDLNDVIHEGYGIYSFEPLGPVVPGHRLFVHEIHTRGAAEDPTITGAVFERAAKYARNQADDFNLITSDGKFATQTIRHTHIHYVPRREGDGLHLPWTGQVK